MADDATGTTSTPAATAAATSTTDATQATTTAADATTTAAATTDATKSTTAQTGSDAATTVAADKTASTVKVETAPTYKLPEDLALAPEVAQKFEGFIKGKTVEGKLALTPQDVVDTFADLARDANTRWQASIVAQDKAWEAESKGRFSPTQLAAAETGVGFLSSFEPAFRELSKGFRNNPTFVNAMRVVGERLSEDTFEIGQAATTPAKRSAKDIMYPKRTN